MYLIRYQGPQWFEPLTYFGNNTLKDVYDYEPVQKDWKPEYASLLMGVQGSMWTEFCNKPEDVDYLLFPRLAALAEVAISSTLANVGPTQGVQAKLKVKPSRKAVTGDMAAVPTENGSRCPLERSLEGPKIPSW